MSSPSKYGWDENVPDEELLRIARAGGDPRVRRAAATEVLCRYRRAVYLWCLRYTRDPERALDLSQDVLSIVWEKLDMFEGRSKFSSWLFAVTRNRCIDAGREGDPVDGGVELFEVTDPSPLPDAIVDGDRDEDWLLAIIRAELAPDEQQAIWLRCVEHMPVETITRIMQLENDTGARALLQRARRRLRAALERHKRA